MDFSKISQHITPRFVIDVGARVGDWAKQAKAAWPDAKFALFEANPECEQSLKESGFPLYAIAVLSDEAGKEVDFYTLKDCPTATGASYYRENTPFFADDKIKVTKVETQTLDGYFDRAVSFTHPILLKLDTQGSELDILKGAEKLLTQVDAIVCEVAWIDYNIGAPTASDVSIFMAKHGFLAVEKLEDIVHPIEREKIIQTDVLYKKLKGYGG